MFKHTTAKEIKPKNTDKLCKQIEMSSSHCSLKLSKVVTKAIDVLNDSISVNCFPIELYTEFIKQTLEQYFSNVSTSCETK